MPRQVREHVGLAGTTLRPNPHASAGRQDRKATRPGAAHQPQEQRFCAIVGVMRGRNQLRADIFGGREQGGSPSVTRARLQIPAGTERQHCARELDAERLALRLRAVELGRGLCAEAVVDAVRNQGKTLLFG
jgi:hypothetical protein